MGAYSEKDKIEIAKTSLLKGLAICKYLEGVLCEETYKQSDFHVSRLNDLNNICACFIRGRDNYPQKIICPRCGTEMIFLKGSYDIIEVCTNCHCAPERVKYYAHGLLNVDSVRLENLKRTVFFLLSLIDFCPHEYTAVGEMKICKYCGAWAKG